MEVLLSLSLARVSLQKFEHDESGIAAKILLRQRYGNIILHCSPSFLPLSTLLSPLAEIMNHSVSEQLCLIINMRYEGKSAENLHYAQNLHCWHMRKIIVFLWSMQVGGCRITVILPVLQNS